MDPATGHVKRHEAWATHYEMSTLVPRADGSFAVFLGDRLQFYSPDFTLRSWVELSPAPGRRRGDLWFTRSPSGRTILIQYNSGDHVSCDWVSGDKVSSQEEKCEGTASAQVCRPNEDRCPTISDEELAAPWMTDNGKYHSGIRIKKFQGPWRKLCTIGGGACSNAEFVADDMLLLWPSIHNQVSLVRNDGKTILDDVVSRGFSVNSYSEKAHLLALPVYERNPDGAPPFSAVLVYNVTTRKRVFEVHTDKEMGIHFLQGLAVSPVGDRLVIQGDGILRSYTLPSR